jgi:hypothetical protein
MTDVPSAWYTLATGAVPPLVGVVVGAAITGYAARRRERRAALREHRDAVAEVLTATLDLFQGMQAVRTAYETRTRRNHIRHVAGILLVSIGSAAPAGEKLTWGWLADFRRTAPMLDRLLNFDTELDASRRRIALDIVSVVAPRVTRFYAATASLRPGDDKELKSALNELIEAVGVMLDTWGEDRKFTHARRRAEKAATAFRQAADKVWTAS